MPLSSRTKSTPLHQRGVGLIEILISLLVLSIGLLGLAAMQTNGLKHNRNAYYRTQATILAYDIVDRMRANSGQSDSYAIAYGAASGTACTSSCTPAQIATTDKLQWKANLAGQLPSGDGMIEDNGSNNFDITIKWTDGEGEATPLVLGVQL